NCVLGAPFIARLCAMGGNGCAHSSRSSHPLEPRILNLEPQFISFTINNLTLTTLDTPAILEESRRAGNLGRRRGFRMLRRFLCFQLGARKCLYFVVAAAILLQAEQNKVDDIGGGGPSHGQAAEELLLVDL